VILIYDNLPAYRAARRRDQLLRDREFQGCNYYIGGIKIRAMSLRDLQILEEIKSPFLFRRWPTNRELVFFLWLLSPEMEKWHDERGWRKQWIFGTRWKTFNLEYWQSVTHGRKCRRLLRLGELENQIAGFNKISPDNKFPLPESSPLARAIKQSFEYIDTMFRDGPKGQSGGESYFSHLAGWSDAVRSEYKCPEAEVFTMPLPKLWQTMRAIDKRKDASATWPSPECERIKKAVRRALKENRFTLEDFINGKPQWDGHQWN
jgi:hypothetical protein